MNKVLDIVEVIIQNITDNQYKSIMESLMEINKIENKNVNVKSTIFKCTSSINWLDSKLEIKPRYYMDVSEVVQKGANRFAGITIVERYSSL
jgi:hypothetical protein